MKDYYSHVFYKTVNSIGEIKYFDFLCNTKLSQNSIKYDIQEINDGALVDAVHYHHFYPQKIEVINIKKVIDDGLPKVILLTHCQKR